MKNFKIFFLIIISGILVSSCMTGGYLTGFGPQGSVFTSITQGVGSNGNSKGPLKGSACTYGVFVFTTFGDGSPEEAAKNGGITNIYTIDKTAFNILSLYRNLCTEVTGDNIPLVSAETKNTATDPAFNDIVVLKNGDILDGVKTVVTAKELIVTDAKGNTTVYPKKEVLSVKKKKK